MTKKVALLIESSRGYGRHLLRGVAAYTRTNGRFSIYRNERTLGDAAPRWLSRWEGDGVIARIESRQLADFLVGLGLPVVDLRGRYEIPDIPRIETDDSSVMKLACDHLLERGLRSIAYCGFEGANYSTSRQQAAIQLLGEHDLSPNIYNSPAGGSQDTGDIEAEGILHERELAQWLHSLPKPTGLIACNDIRGAQVLSVCRELEIAVPDELAVIGVDDDRLICELTAPPMSSVLPDAIRVGYLAAKLLDELIDGETVTHLRRLIAARNVVARQSTDMLAIDDSDVASALRFIRDNAGNGISVDDVAVAVMLSRSTLDRRFARHTGTTVKAEITRVRVERVKQLLSDTDYSIATIACMVGYSHAEYMSTMFKDYTGESPGQFRKLYQSHRMADE